MTDLSKTLSSPTIHRLGPSISIAMVYAIAILSLASAGCFSEPIELGGEKVIKGAAELATGFGRAEPNSPDFRGWHGVLHLRTDQVNRDGIEPKYCLHIVSLAVNSRENPQAYKMISNAMDEDGKLDGIYIEFRSVTVTWTFDRETMELRELIDVRAPPAGVEWKDQVCPP